jgi:hypothetical protein
MQLYSHFLETITTENLNRLSITAWLKRVDHSPCATIMNRDEKPHPECALPTPAYTRITPWSNSLVANSGIGIPAVISPSRLVSSLASLPISTAPPAGMRPGTTLTHMVYITYFAYLTCFEYYSYIYIMGAKYRNLSIAY